ncbi:hypothetical protein DICVIV_12163 [Dictyocaulus viviparus]|uniref:Uncharacterized protein n=1 Tax=Dictyocaulus viviparus TaxID=29172 RepID=A0A0D8XHP4_DICVI|nr:hypothetical protein DICVIV_12163 [Dictyocaulus viviparus]
MVADNSNLMSLLNDRVLIVKAEEEVFEVGIGLCLFCFIIPMVVIAVLEVLMVIECDIGVEHPELTRLVLKPRITNPAELEAKRQR